MQQALNDAALEQLFLNARTYNGWQDKPISKQTLHRLYELLRWGPTSANSCPARFVFVQSAEAKQKLEPCLMQGNVEKTMAAPVTVIVAHDLTFFEQLPKLAPHADIRSWFIGKPKFTETTAFRNGTLQGAYLMLAARALGLDCGPMSGFNTKKVDEAFFPDSQYRSNFLVNLGYGDPQSLHPRAPRLDFDEACEVL